MSSLKRHTASHDKANVTGTKDDDFFARHTSFDVHQTLRRTGGKNSGRAKTGNGKCTTWALTTTHGQNDGPRMNVHETVP